MRTNTTLLLLGAVLLTGCTTTPSPTETIDPANFQARLTDATGRIEGSGGPALGLGGAISGDGCIYTQLGAVPAGTVITLTKGECTAELTGPEVAP